MYSHRHRRDCPLQPAACIPEHAAYFFHSNGDLYLCSADDIALPYCTTLDLNTGEVTHERVLPPPGPNEEIRGLEFPTIRKSLQGRRSRYSYFMEFDASYEAIAVVKMDTEVRC